VITKPTEIADFPIGQTPVHPLQCEHDMTGITVRFPAGGKQEVAVLAEDSCFAGERQCLIAVTAAAK
jgi:hypothetical protein